MQIDDVSGVIDEKLLITTLTTNVIGPIRLTGALIEHLKRQKDAAVINKLIGSGVRAARDDGGLFGDEGRAAFIHAVPSLQAQGQPGEGA